MWWREYQYDQFGEHSGQVTYARNLYDATLDRSYDYDHVGRLQYAHTGVEARMHALGQPNDGSGYGSYSQHTYYDSFGNLTQRLGWGGANPSDTTSYTNNRMTHWQYDATGNMTWDGGAWSFTYDVTGQQTSASVAGTQMSYDGDRLRVKKEEHGQPTYYLRSSVLGGQVVCELNSLGQWMIGYVYLGSQLVALQQAGVKWVHQDPVTKSQRLTDQSGAITAVVDLDPWGGETTRSSESWRQPRKYTSYERDAIGSDEAMHRRYNSWWRRFEQPDPYDGSMNLAEPQSFNRYSYVQNDPVNFVDPSGLNMQAPNCYPTAMAGNESFFITLGGYAQYMCVSEGVGAISFGGGRGPAAG